MSKCFLVQLKPFQDKIDPSVLEFEKKAIAHPFCGIGWRKPGFALSIEKCLLSEHLQKFRSLHLNECENYEGKSDMLSLTKALNRYNEMRPGDYVLTRLRNARCYIGKVTSYAYYLRNIPDSFPEAEKYSWVVDVEWKDIGEFLMIPNALRGLMSRPLHIADNVLHPWHSSLIEQLYTNEFEPIPINETNSMHTLDSNDLEDLVSLFIIHQQKETGEMYSILPSSCKKNEPLYEFRLISGRKSILCQVKNNAEINCREYYVQSPDFHAIYLYSGIGKYGIEDFSNKPENLIIIDNQELYDFLKKCHYLREMLSKYYELTK